MPNVFDQFDGAAPKANPFDQFDAKPEPVKDFSGNLRVALPFGLPTIDTGISMPEGSNRRLAQLGSGFDNLRTGAAQMFGSETAADGTDKKLRDKALNNDFTGKALNFAGETLPMVALPAGWASAAGRAAPVIEGAVLGGAQGALAPVAQGESRAANVALGAGFGAGLPAAVQVARGMATPVNGDLARTAINQYGIPLGVADVSENKIVKSARSLLNDLPITASMGAADKAGIQQAFNREVGRTFGMPSTTLGPAEMATARANVGGELDRIWNNNNLRLDGQFIQDLQGQMGRLQSLNPEQARMVNGQIQNLLQRVGPNGEVPGSFVNNWQSEMRLMAEGDKGLAKDVLNQVRQSTIQAFNRGVTGPDAQALTAARGQYKALKTVEPIMNKADAGVAGRVSGDVPAALLPAVVAQSYGRNVATSPFADLSPIAGRYLVDRVAQTGGSARALLQNSGVGALALGGAGAATGTLLPMAAGVGGATALQGLLGSTRAAQGLLNPAMPRGLLDQASMAAALRELGGNAAYRLPIQMGLGMATVPALD